MTSCYLFSRVRALGVFLTTLTLAVAGCGGDSGSGPTATVNITGYSGSLTFLGATAQLSASSSAGSIGSVQWSSSDAGIASVSSAGLVTAIAPGQATISAQAGNATGSLSVVVDPAPASLLSQAGDAQGGTVGTALGTMVVVEVRDEGGSPIPGELVTFSPSDGGTATPPTGTTDAQGRARTTWTLGTSAGVQTLQASSGGPSLSFTATAAPGAPTALLAQFGNGETGLAGDPLPEPVRALAADQYGNGVPGISVTFTASAGSGAPSATSVTSDAQGLASVVWTLGRYAGEHVLTAQAGTLGTTTFMATALPNGVITGTATAVTGWFPVAPAGGLRAAVSTPKLQATPFTSWAQVATRPARIPLPRQDLVVQLRKPDLPALAQAATTAAAAEAQADVLTALSRGLSGGESFEVSGVSPAIRTVRLTVDDGVDPASVLASLRSDPRVESAELDGVAWAFGRSPNDGRSAASANAVASARYGADPGRLGGPGAAPVAPTSEPLYPWQAWHYESIGLESAWKLTRGSPNVVVAVVDDGIRFDHPDLSAALLGDGFDFVQDGNIPVCGGGQIGNAGDGDGPDPDPTTPMLYEFDQSGSCIQSVGGTGGHGTHVAGTIGARDQTGGLVGVAPGVRILPVRVLAPHGSGSLYDIAQGVLYAAGLPADAGAFGFIQNSYGAHVINLSLGGPTSNPALQAAVQAATSAGSLVVASAGNDGTPDARYPAAYPEALSVSSVGPTWAKPGYSSFGSTVDIAAPGGAVVDAGGDPLHGVWSSTWDFDTGQPNWEGWQGTSMAAPHVAGVAALLFSQSPGRTAAEVRSLLESYARDLGPAGWDPTYGHGLLDALSSLTLGAGIPGDTWVALFDAASGAVVDVGATAPGGSYSFGGLPDGDYYVYGGLDEFGSGLFGLATQPFSAYGGGSHPTPITVDGAGALTRSFAFARPFESEPNQNTATADQMMIGGYVEGLLDGGSDIDFFEIRVAQTGTYRFETYGLYGACGFAVVPDTVLHLHDDRGIPMTSGDDIDGSASLYCSRIEAQLQPGTYYLRVSSFGGNGTGGLYGLWGGLLN